MVWCKKAIVMNGSVLEYETYLETRKNFKKSLQGNYFGMENMVLKT